jgi:hypothetical protein
MLDTIETKAAGGESLPAAPAVQHKGICILGSNPSNKHLAPFNDPSWLIYACSPDNSPYGSGPGAGALPRFDGWVEAHDPIEDHSRPYAYIRYLETLPLVWMRDKRAMATGLFKGARPYPEEKVKAKFCNFMFTSTVAYMLAKAIVDCEEQGIPQIALHGILQSSAQEYAYQRPGTQYFIWEATQRGIKVLAAKESQLFEMPKEKW